MVAHRAVIARMLVIGAGFGGSVVARELAHAGAHVHVTERRHHIAGNAYDALANVAAVGSNSEWVGGSLKTPPIQIEKLSVIANT